jgi:hypothetical protein
MSESFEEELFRRAFCVHNSADRYGLTKSQAINAVWIERSIAIQRRHSAIDIWRNNQLVFTAKRGDYRVRNRSACLEVNRILRRMMVLVELANV